MKVFLYRFSEFKLKVPLKYLSSLQDKNCLNAILEIDNMNKKTYPLLAGFLLLASSTLAAQTEILVTIGNDNITDKNLEHALNSSPFATQFNTMNRAAQASLRGDMLRRLVISHLLRKEALSLKLDRDPTYQQDLQTYTKGLLYRRYMDKLRADIKIPTETLEAMQKFYKDNLDGFAAARAAQLTDTYKATREQTLQALKQRFHTQSYTDQINANTPADTVLFSGDDNIKITYGDIVDPAEHPTAPTKAWVESRLYQKAELEVISRAGKAENFDLNSQITAYGEDRLPALLLEKKTQEWTGDEPTLKAYFDSHPEIAIVPERIHIGQIVLKTEQEAKELRQQILDGKSLFELAEQHSIDPYGKQHRGDMGWVKVGMGMPEIEKAISGLKDDEISPIVKTVKGYHLVTIIERRTGSTRKYNGVKDRVKEQLITEKMSTYMRNLEKKYNAVWHVLNG